MNQLVFEDYGLKCGAFGWVLLQIDGLASKVQRVGVSSNMGGSWEVQSFVDSLAEINSILKVKCRVVSGLSPFARLHLFRSVQMIQNNWYSLNYHGITVSKFCNCLFRNGRTCLRCP